MKELTEIRDGLFALFEAKNVKALQVKIMEAVIKNDYEKYTQYTELVEGDLETDYLQMMWQYYGADRKILKQDYTPKSLGKLLARLTAGSIGTVDLCAGSGALSIQAATDNPDLEIIAIEYDETVIPFLLFNLAIRNICGEVRSGDALQDAGVSAVFNLVKGDRYSICTQIV